VASSREGSPRKRKSEESLSEFVVGASYTEEISSRNLIIFTLFLRIKGLTISIQGSIWKKSPGRGKSSSNEDTDEETLFEIFPGQKLTYVGVEEIEESREEEVEFWTWTQRERGQTREGEILRVS